MCGWKPERFLPDGTASWLGAPAQESQHPALHLHLYNDLPENATYFLALNRSAGADNGRHEYSRRESIPARGPFRLDARSEVGSGGLGRQAVS